MNSNTHQAFLEQYKEIHEPFVRYCSSRAYGILSTEDLVQEAVLAALKGFDQLTEPRKLLSYMIGTVNNLLRNRRRRAHRQGEWDEQLLQKLESQTPDPDIALDIHYLLKAMDQLADRQKEALLLFEISGFSIREISELQYSSETATKTRIHRARQRLKELMGERRPKTSLSSAMASFRAILL
ncbi:MAG: RNA polymerase sigma factor [Bacteroidota bacterium]